MTLHTGENMIDGVPVSVVRRRAKRIIIRVKPGGEVAVTVPPWRATLAEAAAFLASKWDWVLRTRERALAQPAPAVRDIAREAGVSTRTFYNHFRSKYDLLIRYYALADYDAAQRVRAGGALPPWAERIRDGLVRFRRDWRDWRDWRDMREDRRDRRDWRDWRDWREDLRDRRDLRDHRRSRRSRSTFRFSTFQLFNLSTF